MNSNPKNLKINELCSILEISESVFKQQWLKKRPVIPRDKSRRTYYYNPQDVYSWLVTQGMIKYAAMLELAGLVDVERAEDLDDSPGIDIYGAFDRLGKIIKTKLSDLERLTGAAGTRYR